MSLAKGFMTLLHVHFIEQVKLQKILITTDVVITEMPLLTHQIQYRHQSMHTGEEPYKSEDCEKYLNLCSSITQDQRLYPAKKEHRQEENDDYFSSTYRLTDHSHVLTCGAEQRALEISKGGDSCKGS
ncbi:hypothetical protein A6R68_01472, partial [Neotoma lepida]